MPSDAGTVSPRRGLYEHEVRGRHGVATVVSCLILLCFPLGLVIAGVSWHQRGLLKPISGATVTTGVISGYRGGSLLRGYSPEISFQTAAARWVRFTAPPTSDLPTPGAPVTVSYSPADPAGAHDLSDGGARWPLDTVVGLLLACLGEWYFWRLMLGFGRPKS